MLEVFAFDELVVSEYVLKDSERALTVKLAVPPEIARGFLWLLRQGAVVATEGEAPPLNLKYKTDIPALAAAVGGKADAFDTGDAEHRTSLRLGASR